jgi:hypothetical protein
MKLFIILYWELLVEYLLAATLFLPTDVYAAKLLLPAGFELLDTEESRILLTWP